MTESLRRLIGKTDMDEHLHWLPLHVHASDTAGVMKWLYKQWLSEAARAEIRGSLSDDEALCLASFLAWAHDLGKVSVAFQVRVTENWPEGKRWLQDFGLLLPTGDSVEMMHAQDETHPIAGEGLLLMAGCPLSVAVIVGSHHGKPWGTERGFDEAEPVPYGSAVWGKKSYCMSWKAVQQEFLQVALERSGYTDTSEIPEVPISAQILLSGLLIMADWIASNTDYFPLLTFPETGEGAEQTRIERGISALNLPLSWCGHPTDDPISFCKERFGFSPNAVQLLMMKAVRESKKPGIYILEAPMGIGKTEAALLTAEILSAKGFGGLYFGLPTQATANAIFSRLKEWGETLDPDTVKSIRLAHGLSELNEDYHALLSHKVGQISADTPSESLLAHEWFCGRKQALLADFVIGTVDQLLLLGLQQKHVMLRHLGISGKTVIVDECHAYDAYMNCYLDRVLHWLGVYGVPVIMLSATLPAERRKEIISAYLGKQKLPDADGKAETVYPALTWTDGTKVQQSGIQLNQAPKTVKVHRLEFEDETDQYQKIEDQLTEALNQGGCAGVIVNTVRKAQQIALQLRQHMPGYKVLLLHSHFIATDRLRHEKQLLQCVGKHSGIKEREKVIIVGTQVLEQSLDIDVDILLTDLCPMDLLLQRIGRLHRHSSHDVLRPEALRIPQCIVMKKSCGIDEGSSKVYGEYLLRRTASLLPRQITLPGEIGPLVQQVYGDSPCCAETEEGYQEAKQAFENERAEMQKNARVWLLPDKVTLGLDGNISNLLERNLHDDEEHAMAAVRQGQPSLQVLVLVQKKNGALALLPWLGEHSWRVDQMPCEEDCRLIASQRLTLPLAFSAPKKLDETLAALDENDSKLQTWKHSNWLKKERVLLLNEVYQAELCGYHISYSDDSGLIYKKGEKTNESDGI